MFLRATVRKKDGKEHTYYSVVENKRLADGRVVQRHVLYLGEINSSQQLAWRKSIEVLDDEHPQSARTIALFPEDRCEAVVGEEDVVRLRLSQLRLERPRQWGGCWLALQLYRELGLDEFWAQRLPPSRKGAYSSDREHSFHAMVNSAWRGQLETGFLRQVFTIRQGSAAALPVLIGFSAFGFPSMGYERRAV